MQQRRPLPVPSPRLHPGLGTKNSRHRHCECKQGHYSHDREGKYPLESNHPGKELGDAQASNQECSCKADVVVFEDYEEKESKGQDSPDGNVGEDATDEGVVAMVLVAGYVSFEGFGPSA